MKMNIQVDTTVCRLGKCKCQSCDNHDCTRWTASCRGYDELRNKPPFKNYGVMACYPVQHEAECCDKFIPKKIGSGASEMLQRGLYL